MVSRRVISLSFCFSPPLLQFQVHFSKIIVCSLRRSLIFGYLINPPPLGLDRMPSLVLLQIPNAHNKCFINIPYFFFFLFSVDLVRRVIDHPSPPQPPAQELHTPDIHHDTDAMAYGPERHLQILIMPDITTGHLYLKIPLICR